MGKPRIIAGAVLATIACASLVAGLHLPFMFLIVAAIFLINFRKADYLRSVGPKDVIAAMLVVVLIPTFVLLKQRYPQLEPLREVEIKPTQYLYIAVPFWLLCMWRCARNWRRLGETDPCANAASSCP